MGRVTMTSEKGFYQLKQHTNAGSKTEFLKHLNLNQNVVFTAPKNKVNEMLKLKFKHGADLTIFPLEDGISNHFYFRFKTVSIYILAGIFESAIQHIEFNNALPKCSHQSTSWPITEAKIVYNIKIRKVDSFPELNISCKQTNALPKFIVEIF